MDPLGALASLGAGLPSGTIQVGSDAVSSGTTSYRSAGIYAQGTYSLFDNFKVTAGARYTWDRTTANSANITYRFPQPNVAVGSCTFAGLGGFPSTITNNLNDCRSSIAQKSDASTWLIGIDYNPLPDLLLYAKYARGYRQGGVNPFAPPPFQQYRPERLDSYEAGAKLTIKGPVSGTINVSGFYNDFTNQIVTSGALSSANAATPTQIIINAGSSRIYGLEAEASLRLFKGFDLSASYAYLHTELLDITQPVAQPGSPYDLFPPTGLIGERLPYAPDHKLSATASYRLPLPESIGGVTLAATYTYSSSFLVVSGPRGTLPGYNLLNLNLNWNDVAGMPIDASLFMTNATNKTYDVGVSDFFNQGFLSYSLAPPRMYGARIRYRFGAK